MRQKQHDPKHLLVLRVDFLVRRERLELSQVTPPDPKSGASTNSAILAKFAVLVPNNSPSFPRGAASTISTAPSTGRQGSSWRFGKYHRRLLPQLFKTIRQSSDGAGFSFGRTFATKAFDNLRKRSGVAIVAQLRL